MKALVMMTAMVLGKALVITAAIVLALLIFHLVSSAIKRADAVENTCRPHIYMSGTVEIRGSPGQVYVIEYKTLSELAALLQTVQDDVDGKIKWMGPDQLHGYD